MKLQIKDGKRIQRDRYSPSIATEGPATSVVRGICANWDCSKFIYLNGRTEVVYCLKYDNGVSLKVNMNNLRSLLILGGVLISFEIMLNFAQISRFKFNDRLFKHTANPSALLPTILHFFSNPALSLRFSYRMLFSCIWDPSSPCISFFSC